MLENEVNELVWFLLLLRIKMILLNVFVKKLLIFNE